jgi:hypothetical protein
MIFDSPFKSIIDNVLKELKESLSKIAFLVFDEAGKVREPPKVPDLPKNSTA